MPRRPASPLRARLAAAALAGLALALASVDARPLRGLAVARAEEDWFLEFEDVCSRTQDAMTLSDDELAALLLRCEKLKPRVDGLDPSRKKVYARRLQLCRDLYQFVLDARRAR